MHVNVIYPTPTSSSGCRILAQTDMAREKHLYHQPLNSHAWPKHYFSSPHQYNTKQASDAPIISWSKTKFSQLTSYELCGRKWRELLNHNAPLEKYLFTTTDPICLLGKWCVLFHKISFLLKFFNKILTKRNNFWLFVFLGRPSHSCTG